MNTTELKAAMVEVAGTFPPIAVAPGLFDRARRKQIRNRITGLIALIGALGAVALMPNLVVPPQPAAPVTTADEMPAYATEAPEWTADVRDAPLSRALVVLDHSLSGEGPEPLTLVGPHDEYRIFQPDVSGSPWDGSMYLSPDGRYLLTGHDNRSQLLDMSTGKTRMIEAGAPLAWSHDGGYAVMVHWDSDVNTSPVTGQIHVVDMPSGTVLWSVALASGPLPRQVEAALSPDGQTLLVRRHADLYAQRSDGGIDWQMFGNELAGQLSWAPNDSVFLSSGINGMCVRVVGSATELRCLDPSRLVAQVVEWSGPDPSLVMNQNREIVDLADSSRLLFEPQSANAVLVATEGVVWNGRDPGHPQRGPVLARYRSLIPWLLLFGAVIVFGAVWRRRRRASILAR